MISYSLIAVYRERLALGLARLRQFGRAGHKSDYE
jgi:hypothetical protein